MSSIGILYGGRSGEHDVSLCTAASILEALKESEWEIVAIGIDRDGRWHVQDCPVIDTHPAFKRVLRLEKTGTWYLNHFEEGGRLVLTNVDDGRRVAVDIVFPAVHGTYCEDGTLQGLLELARVPFVGADTLGSAIGMDKDVAKRLLRDSGIPVVPWITVTSDEWMSRKREIVRQCEAMGFPLFVKPSRAGSSVGVGKVKESSFLADAVEAAFRYDTKVLVERGVDAREIECAVLGNDAPCASILGEVKTRHEFYSYESKYLDPEGAELSIPAEIDPGLAEEIRAAAVRAYRALCCSGMARVDFFLDRAGGEYYCNEINTIPGFTSISMYPKLWEHTGVSYRQLVSRLIELALERHRARMSVMTAR